VVPPWAPPCKRVVWLAGCRSRRFDQEFERIGTFGVSAPPPDAPRCSAGRSVSSTSVQAFCCPSRSARRRPSHARSCSKMFAMDLICVPKRPRAAEEAVLQRRRLMRGSTFVGRRDVARRYVRAVAERAGRTMRLADLRPVVLPVLGVGSTPAQPRSKSFEHLRHRRSIARWRSCPFSAKVEEWISHRSLPLGGWQVIADGRLRAAFWSSPWSYWSRATGPGLAQSASHFPRRKAHRPEIG
jgi:hypothetical protein